MGTLPPELWALVLGFAVDASISPHEFCNYLNFPNISLHFQFPGTHVLHSPLLRDLRLVSRTFNSLIGSPYYIMNKSMDQIAITNWTRALYTGGAQGTRMYLQALVDKPYSSHQLVLLQIRGSVVFALSQGGKMNLFDLLCDSAPTALPNVQTLIFCGDESSFSEGPLPYFWALLNDAFPRLRTLAISGCDVKDANPLSPATFEQVRVLSLPTAFVPYFVTFPSLQHVSLGYASTAELPRSLVAPRSLESLHCQGLYVTRRERLRWEAFPHLRLLSVPYNRVHKLSSPPSSHPLRHIRVHFEHHQKTPFSHPSGEKDRLAWLARLLNQFPNVNRFTVDSGIWWSPVLDWEKEDFDESGLILLGVYVNRSASRMPVLVMD
ncbi:hypothetical protein M408DRAFT_31208, partial [Serendipita vermifera MAFF 305830]